MPKDTQASVWEGRERVAHGCVESGEDPQACQMKAREY